MKAKLHRFLTSALDVGEWSVLLPVALLQGKESLRTHLGVEVGPKTSLDILEKTKSLVPRGIRNPDC